MTSTTLTEREQAIAGVKGCSRMEDLTWPVAVVFLLLGIVSDAANVTLGLDALHWFLLGIAGLLGAIFFRMGKAIYWDLNTPE